MQASHIAMGGSYYVKGMPFQGRAVVTGSRQLPGGRYEFQVVYPDSSNPDRTHIVTSRDIERVWTHADQEKLVARQAAAKEREVKEQALTAAGYKPMWVRSAPQGKGSWIAFDGEDAERVIETLLASPHTAALKLLTEKGGEDT